MSQVLPDWFKYLQASYPWIKLDNPALSCAIYKNAVAEFELTEKQMLDICIELAKHSRFWPAVSLFIDAARKIHYAPGEDDGLREERSFALWEKKHEALMRDIEIYKDKAKGWDVCPYCEEPVSDLDDCPFCADMAAMQADISVAL